MDRALVGDLHEAGPLLVIERALEQDAALDAIDLAALGLAGRSRRREILAWRSRTVTRSSGRALRSSSRSVMAVQAPSAASR